MLLKCIQLFWIIERERISDGVGWDATSSKETKIKYEEMISFATRWRDWQYLPLPHHFKATIELVATAASAGMWASSAVAWECTNA